MLMMLLLLSPAKDWLLGSHLRVTEDPRTTHFISVMILGFLPRQTWSGHAPECPGKKFDFLSLVTGHWHSTLPTGVRGSSGSLLQSQLRVEAGATRANTK